MPPKADIIRGRQKHLLRAENSLQGGVEKGPISTTEISDITMTREIKDAAEKLSIQIHDHLIIGKKGHSSFKSLGLL